MHDTSSAEIPPLYKQVFCLHWQNVHLVLLNRQTFCQFGGGYKMLTITPTLTLLLLFIDYAEAAKHTAIQTYICRSDGRWFVSKDLMPFYQIRAVWWRKFHQPRFLFFTYAV